MMNIINLAIGLMLNMTNVENVEHYSHVTNDSQEYYYIEIFNDKNYITIEYTNESLWYKDINTINSFTFTEEKEEKKEICMEFIPGIPQICNGVKN